MCKFGIGCGVYLFAGLVKKRRKPLKNQKIPQRKDRKRERRSKDRSSHSERKKRHIQLSAELNQLAWDIVKLLPKKDRSDEGIKFICPDCKKPHCKNAHADTEYCETCYWGSRNACGKTVKGLKKCNNCLKGEENAIPKPDKTMPDMQRHNGRGTRRRQFPIQHLSAL